MSLTKRSYSKKNDWSELNIFSLDKSYVHYMWEPMIQELFKDKERKKRIEEKINEVGEGPALSSTIVSLLTKIAGLQQLKEKSCSPKQHLNFKSFDEFLKAIYEWRGIGDKKRDLSKYPLLFLTLYISYLKS